MLVCNLCVISFQGNCLQFELSDFRTFSWYQCFEPLLRIKTLKTHWGPLIVQRLKRRVIEHPAVKSFKLRISLSQNFGHAFVLNASSPALLYCLGFPTSCKRSLWNNSYELLRTGGYLKVANTSLKSTK